MERVHFLEQSRFHEQAEVLLPITSLKIIMSMSFLIG